MDKHTYGSDNRRMLIAQTDQDDFSSEIAAATDVRSAATGSIINESGLESAKWLSDASWHRTSGNLAGSDPH